MKKRFSKRTIALLAAAVVMLTGGVVGTRAQLSVFSDPYKAEFALDYVGIVLVEDNEDVGTSEILKDVSLQPGKVVDESIKAANNTETNQFVRIIVTKYWKNAKGQKDPSLDPSLIKFTGGSGWILNKAESTAERDIYYYPEALPSDEMTSPVYEGFKVDSSVLTQKDADGKLVYNDCSVCIELEVQSVQTHNADEAIPSVWGTPNVTADEDTLKLQVRQ